MRKIRRELTRKVRMIWEPRIRLRQPAFAPQSRGYGVTGPRMARMGAVAVAAGGGRVTVHSETIARVADPDGNLIRLMAVGGRSGS